AISVGITNGGHSRGGTPIGIDSPGRSKPEIVAFSNYTSFATARVASAAALLRAATAGTAAAQPDAIKAILMAGATKEEFPGWQRPANAPLDPVFGAGELNVFHAYRIAEAGQAPPGGSAPARGWDRRAAAPSGAHDYTITIPGSGNAGADELSAVLAWHRLVPDTIPGRLWGAGSELPDFDLALFHGGTEIARSQSAAGDNVEHIYLRNLPPGTYTLRVEGGGTAEFALAWRTEPGPGIRAALDPDLPGAIVFSHLMAGESYAVERATDLTAADWEDVATLEPTGADFAAWQDPDPPAGRAFYRLRWVVGG
ncbi:MAG: hypothetical protein R3F11_10725, partial [Verrucomicrobiales bacterium]